MAGSYYQTSSSYEGSVTEQTVQELHSSDQADDETLVWSASLGGEWRAIRDAGVEIVRVAPPALPIGPVNDIYALEIVAVPVVGAIAEIITADIYQKSGFFALQILSAYGCVYFVLGLLDRHQVELARGD
jgi:hypothetical protein